MPQQQASIQTIVAMLTDQGRKLDDMKVDFDRFRVELPDDYAPRRETDKAFADIARANNDHEARLRMIEARIPNTEFSAYKDTTAAREKASNDTAQNRFLLDERAINMLWGVLLAVGIYLIYHLSSLLPLH
jgi:hypothetical protein